jgi:hypothetical protein
MPVHTRANTDLTGLATSIDGHTPVASVAEKANPAILEQF